MNLDARTQRTLLRLLATFLAAGAGDALIQFSTGATAYDWRHLAGALVAAAVLAAEQWLKNSGENAPPTVAAVNQALQPGPAEGITSFPAAAPRTVAPPSKSRAG